MNFPNGTSAHCVPSVSSHRTSKQSCPELVVTDERGYKAVKSNQLPIHMLQAIKELKTEKDRLREQLQVHDARSRQQQEQLHAQEERLRRLEAFVR